MKIAQIFSNWKWTGPAEHALNLAIALVKTGHDVTFLCAPPPDGVEDSLSARARQAGILPVTDFRLNKHFNIIDNAMDIPAMRRFIKQQGFDIIHTHLPNDHFVAGIAGKTSFLRKVIHHKIVKGYRKTQTIAGKSNYIRPAIFRTCYDGENIPSGWKTRMCLSFLTDALIVISDAAERTVRKRHYLHPRKCFKLEVPVDINRFDVDRIHSRRAFYSLTPDAVVGGIVARVQKHRRFEVILEAIQIVARDFPAFRFMVIGRGTHINEVAVKPSQNMGIRSNLIFTGYQQEAYPETLACLNFKVFLVPGSDGSCRAVREAFALGIPVIAAKRGILPEIVEDGKTGLLIDDTPENLAKAIMFMVENPERRKLMGMNALAKAQTRFNLDFQAKKTETLYKKFLN